MVRVTYAPDGRALLNIGCGTRFHPDWTNLDHYPYAPSILQHDLNKPLPFADGTFDVVYHSHVLEHFSRAGGRALLQECARVLKRGGTLRVVVPDLAFSARLYLQALADVQADPNPVNEEHYEWAVLYLIDQMTRTRSGGEMATFMSRQTLHDLAFVIEQGGGNTLRDLRAERTPQQPPTPKPALPVRAWRWLAYQRTKLLRRLLPLWEVAAFRQRGEVHQWMYDAHALRQLLLACGFTQIVELDERSSTIDGWGSFYLDVDPDGSVHKPRSLVMEARKP